MSMVRVRYSISMLFMVLVLAACGAGGNTGTDTAASASAVGSTAASASASDSTAASTPASAAASASVEASTEATAAASSAATTETETAAAGGTLTVYSGRNEELVGPLLEQFKQDTGIDVQIKYGDTAELAATILEEGANTPADVFFAQDAGALGALTQEGRLQTLSDDLLNRVDERFRADNGEWVGVSGRARVVIFNTATYTDTDLPESIFGFTDPKFKGRIGWAPTNGSFQSFVTALRVLEGEERAREWLEGIQANEPKVYENNTAVVQAAAAGEIDVGFVNHYYLFRQLAEQGQDFGARNYYLKNGDPGALINVAGAGILKESKNQAAAEQFINYLLSESAQQYFADETYEYPLIEGVQANEALPALSEIQTPDLDLSQLKDLQGTVQLLQDLGIL